MDEFIAIDVETANAARSSICQVGMARYKDGQLTHEWKSYVDPEDHFDGMNISIHGITESTVKGAPDFPKVAETIRKALNGRIVACHSGFDRASIARACEKYGIPSPNCTWLDTARVARRAWVDDFAQSGYGLASVCHFLDYSFGHHDALEDAKASGHILLCAIRDTGISLSDWKKRVLMPVGSDESVKHARAGNVEGALFGEVLVFTGALEIPRRDAADLAAKAGCDVASGVNKKTTIVVVGDQDTRVLADGADKSTKHRKAEELIAKGQHIRIIGETDFLKMLEVSTN
ncbi:MAG: transposase [Desulfuromonadales bacterium]|nr:transposase [Desulfuromonadales bacterium]